VNYQSIGLILAIVLEMVVAMAMWGVVGAILLILVVLILLGRL
jgi:hypothetical protein